MRYKNDKNITLVITRFVFNAQNASKPVFDQGSVPDPGGGAFYAPQIP